MGFLSNIFLTKVEMSTPNLSQIIPEATNAVDGAFSTYKMDLPKNVNIPLVYSTDSKSPCFFGDGHSHPLFIQQSFQISTIQSRCFKFINGSIIAGGMEWVGFKDMDVISKKDILSFELKNDFDNLFKQITSDYIKHSRINIRVTKQSNGEHLFERINPTLVVYAGDKSCYYYSKNKNERSFGIKYEKYVSGCKPGVYMIDFDDLADEFYPYPVASWNSAFISIKNNASIAEFQDANLENSVNPSLIIYKPSKFQNNDEKRKYLSDIRSQKGKGQTGNVMLFSAASKELLPEVQQLEANKNGDLFKSLREITIEDVCQGWGINPILVGLKTPGSLGQTFELEMSIQQANKIVVEPVIKHVEKSLNKLILMANLVGQISINRADIYDLKNMITLKNEDKLKEK